jgi:excisionase family DNA binding protein
MERVSVSEAAKRLGISSSTVRRRMKSGELASEREAGTNGRVWVLLGETVEDRGPELDASQLLRFTPPTPSVEPAAEVAQQTAWPTAASRAPISLEAERAARRAGAGPSLGFAWGARDRRTYRWLAAGTEAHPVFGDLSRAARYHDRSQALAAIRIAQADAEPAQVFVEMEGSRGVA